MYMGVCILTALMALCVCLCVVTDGDGVPSSRWPGGCRAVARAKPPGDEGGEPIPLEPWVCLVSSYVLILVIIFNSIMR